MKTILIAAIPALLLLGGCASTKQSCGPAKNNCDTTKKCCKPDCKMACCAKQ